MQFDTGTNSDLARNAHPLRRHGCPGASRGPARPSEAQLPILHLRLRHSPSGAFAREIPLDARRSAQAIAGDLRIVAASLLNDQSVAIDLTEVRSPAALTRGIGLLQRFVGSSEIRRSCSFQIDDEQARDRQVQKLLSASEVHVRVNPLSAGPAELALAERYPRWSAVFAAEVRPVCPPLATEPASAVLPGLRTLVPAHAAVLVATLDTRELTDGVTIETARIRQLTRRTVRLADRAIDEIRWPLASLAADAFMNRRLAIVPTGLGAVALRAGFEPGDPAALAWLRQLVTTIVDTARAESRLLALTVGRMPSIEPRHVFAHMTGRPEVVGRHRRWEQAIGGHWCRNRQLVFLSLDSLWPDDEPGRAEFAGLLPVLSAADGIVLGSRWPELGGGTSGRLRILRLACALGSRR